MQPPLEHDYPISGLVVPLTQLFPYDRLRLASLWTLGQGRGFSNPLDDYQALLENGETELFGEAVDTQTMLVTADQHAREVLLSSPRAMFDDQALRLLCRATEAGWRVAIATTLPIEFAEELLRVAAVPSTDYCLLHSDPCGVTGRLDDLWYQRLYPQLNISPFDIVVVEDDNHRASVVLKGERRVLFVSSRTHPDAHVSEHAWRTASSLLEINESLFLSPGSLEPRSSCRRVGLHPAARSMRG